MARKEVHDLQSVLYYTLLLDEETLSIVPAAASSSSRARRLRRKLAALETTDLPLFSLLAVGQLGAPSIPFLVSVPQSMQFPTMTWQRRHFVLLALTLLACCLFCGFLPRSRPTLAIRQLQRRPFSSFYIRLAYPCRWFQHDMLAFFNRRPSVLCEIFLHTLGLLHATWGSKNRHMD